MRPLNLKRRGWRDQKGSILVVLLLGAVIVLLLAWFFLFRGKTHKAAESPFLPSSPPTTPGLAQQQARGVECRSNLNQIRQAIQMYLTSEESFPPNLSALSSYGVTPSLRQCPVSGYPYQYDPRTGKVWCMTPGHQGF